MDMKLGSIEHDYHPEVSQTLAKYIHLESYTLIFSSTRAQSSLQRCY